MSQIIDQSDDTMFLDPENPFGLELDLPEEVLDEGKRAVTTMWDPRGTIDDAPVEGSMSNPGYEVPAYAQEAHGVTPRVTPRAPRGTYDKVPEKMYRKRKADPKLIYADHATENDPFVMYGEEASEIILSNVNQLATPAERVAAMRIMLDAIDDGMWSKVAVKAEKWKKKHGAKEALRRALASAVALQALKEVVQIGKTGPTNKGLAGLGAYDTTAYAYTRAGELLNSELYGPLGMGGFGSWVKGKARKAKNATKSAIKSTYRGLKNLTCKLSNSGALDFAAAAGGAAAGGPAGAQAGAAGAKVLGNMCGGDEAAQAPALVMQPPPPYMAPQKSNTLLYVGVGGAALLLLVVAMKK